MLQQCVLLVTLASCAHGFYLPGVVPQEFAPMDQVKLKVNKLTSTTTHLPKDYYQSAPFCRPKKGVEKEAENLGEFLSGDRIENSPYQLKMKYDEHCKPLCIQTLSNKHVKEFEYLIKNDYRHNWIVDNLPAASITEDAEYQYTSYARGFPVGLIESGAGGSGHATGKYYLYNHATIMLEHHDIGNGKFRIVGFQVEPFSVAHEFKDGYVWDPEVDEEPTHDLATCNPNAKMQFDDLATYAGNKKQELKGGKVIFSYGTTWTESDTRWATRWDIYLSMDNAVPDKVHWFSIINALLIVLFLTAMIAMIMMRALYRDIARYNRVPTEEERAEEREESGWKLVHADVFRPPATRPMLYCVFVGTGVQLLAMSIITLFFAAAGFLSPANRGSLMIALLLLYVCMGVPAGYCSARVYKTFRGKLWQKCTVFTALLFPGGCFGVFFILDLIEWSKQSTAAVPFLSMFAVLALWFGISVPLVFLGAYFGYKKEPIEFPVVTSNLPRQVPPQPWYMSTMFTALVAGVLPFGAIFVELFFILSSLWLDQYYYVFGFLLLVFLILIVTCAEITVVLCYFQLCSEDYHWWWRSFLSSGSTAAYVWLYSAYYFSKLEHTTFTAGVLYFSYMSLISFGLFLLTGCIGFFSCFWFNRKIYGSIKVD